MTSKRPIFRSSNKPVLRQHGFTLLETLVAMMIPSVVRIERSLLTHSSESAAMRFSMKTIGPTMLRARGGRGNAGCQTQVRVAAGEREPHAEPRSLPRRGGIPHRPKNVLEREIRPLLAG